MKDNNGSSLAAINIIKGLAYSQLEVCLIECSSKTGDLSSLNPARSTQRKFTGKLIVEKLTKSVLRISSIFWGSIEWLPMRGNASTSSGSLEATNLISLTLSLSYLI